MLNGKNGFFDLDVGKAFSQFSMPAMLDAESVISSQRKNIEALTQANQLAVEGVQAVTRRQVEIAREAFEGAQAAIREFTQPVAPEDRIAKNAEYAKQIFEKSMANAREIAELFTKANSEALDVITKRFTESLDELREQAQKSAAR